MHACREESPILDTLGYAGTSGKQPDLQSVGRWMAVGEEEEEEELRSHRGIVRGRVADADESAIC